LNIIFYSGFVLKIKMNPRFSKEEFETQLDARVITDSYDLVHQMELYSGAAIHTLPPAKKLLQDLMEEQGNQFKARTFGELKEEYKQTYDVIVLWLYKCFKGGVFKI